MNPYLYGGDSGIEGSILLQETFEGSNGGYDLAGWAATGVVNPDYAVSPLQGAQSLRITASGAETKHSYTLGLARTARFRFRAAVLPAADVVIAYFRHSSDGQVTRLHLDPTGHLLVECAGSASSPYTVNGMSAATNYCIKLHYSGTGVSDVEFQTSFNFVGTGNNYTIEAVATPTAGADEFAFTNETDASLDAVFDDLTISG